MQTKRETQKRHSTLACKSYRVKIDSSHLNKKTLEILPKFFLEAKWFYNFALTQDFKTFDTKIREVKILNKEKIEESRVLKHLSAQMKQGLFTRIINVEIL